MVLPQPVQLLFENKPVQGYGLYLYQVTTEFRCIIHEMELNFDINFLATIRKGLNHRNDQIRLGFTLLTSTRTNQDIRMLSVCYCLTVVLYDSTLNVKTSVM
jgi:hypothetical protein